MPNFDELVTSKGYENLNPQEILLGITLIACVFNPRPDQRFFRPKLIWVQRSDHKKIKEPNRIVE